MKLGIAAGFGLVWAVGSLGCAQQGYAGALQRCIIQARYDIDAGSYDARLEEYRKCADDVDRDAGLALPSSTGAGTGGSK
jgi:hypothetical protein